MSKSIIIILILLMLCFFAQAQEPISFRSQALGGIVYDDLDLIYDPIQLRFVDGIRLYTNLSNLTSYNEELFNNVSDNEFLFGISTENPFLKNLWTSALVRYQNSHFSNPISIDSDLNGFDDIYSEGNFKDIYNAYLDTDFNGLYDTRQEISQEKTDFSMYKKNIYVLNNTYLLSKWTLGLKIATGNTEGEGTTTSYNLGSGYGWLSGSNYGDPTFNINFNNYLIEDVFKTLEWDENGEYLSQDEDNFTSLNGAFMVPLKLVVVDSVEVRGDIGYMMDDNTYNINDSYSGTQDYFNQDISNYERHYSENESFNYKNERTGNALNFNLQMRKKFKKSSKRINEGFWAVDIGMNIGSYDYSMNQSNIFNSTENYFDGTDTLNFDYIELFNGSSSETDKGDESNNTFYSSFRINIPLGEKVHIGTGLMWDYTSIERNTKYSEDYTTLFDYEQLDTLLSNDYTTEVTRQMQADRTYERTIYRIRFPVGIEYKFTEENNWSIRFGSIFEYAKVITNDRYEITNSEPMRTITEYADGRDPSVTFTDNIYTSTSSHIKEAQSTTTFVYGLGYQPTENLQFDLLGFLGTSSGLQIIDSAFYKSLKLSISVKL
ncbi:MAG: hypothetical protein KAS18_06450 [Calditrichia bacterium]|nr:hypothetical protein [Calditrichia bacterium]